MAGQLDRAGHVGPRHPMPWKLKRELYFILLGCATVVLGLVVAVRDASIDTKLLGIAALIGGLAMFLNALSGNGNGDHEG